MPTRGVVLTEVQDAIDAEIVRNGLVPFFIRTHDLPLPASRNFLVESAMKIPGWSHVLLLDDDVIIPEGGLKQLIALKADIAVMDYPLHMVKDGKNCGTVVTDKDGSIAWAGIGCCLVKREVFEKLSQPWFAFTNYRINRADDGALGIYAGQTGDANRYSGGEDTHFFLNARKEGFKIKQTKKHAVHCHIEQMVLPTQNRRYVAQNKIVKRNKIEAEMV